MNYKEAYEKMMNTPWKTGFCNSGDACWCRLVTPVEEIVYNENEEMYVIGDGSIDKDTAEYIVELHNQKLKSN